MSVLVDSPPDSPARKRLRLSSPVFDGFIDNFSQEDFATFDAIEANFFQSTPSQVTEKFPEATNDVKEMTLDTPLEEPDNPFSTVHRLPGFASASSSGYFQKASTLDYEIGCDDNSQNDASPQPAEPDFDSWFKPINDTPSIGFRTAKFAPETPESRSPAIPTLVTTNAGFIQASKKGVLLPSKTALAVAQAKMNAMLKEEEITESANTQEITSISGSSLKRPALRSLENSSGLSSSPSCSVPRSKESGVSQSPSVGRPSGKGKGRTPEIENNSDQASFPPLGITGSRGTKQFVSPLVKSSLQAHAKTESDNPLIMTSQLTTCITPRKAAPVAGPYLGIRHTPSFSTPRTSGFKSSNRRFTTPFKEGARPITAGTSSVASEKSPHYRQSPVQTRFFDLGIPPNRLTLESCGFLPGQYDACQLDTCSEVDPLELKQITPSLAMYYSFHAGSDIGTTHPAHNMLGSEAALEELKRRGCNLAKKPWVDNHWALILWKLAGMALFNPQQEKDPITRKWCWTEVMRQLLYRYERELNQGKRPAFNKITTRDAPAALPMVLCISNIFFQDGGYRHVDRHYPELEVTDGWYRLRARIDAPLARAVSKGVIRIGRKIGIAGAWLSSNRKEPSEVLEAYDTTKLVLSGNSSHLMPWHTKLGFRKGPFISTLHSLTADGGSVAVMDVVVTKTFPVAYMEFFDGDDVKRREGPRSGAEESRLHDQWKAKREHEVSKLRNEMERRFTRYEGYIARLERRAGHKFDEEEILGTPPNNLDVLYDRLENPEEANNTILEVKPCEAGWLANHIRTALEQERERAADDIERELQKTHPPRDVRSFRVIVVQDACTRKRPANRIAQITVWDVLNLSLAESNRQGTFQSGQRYVVTNLVPTQQSAWMNYESGSQIFLSTKRDSRWFRLS
ncbi:hypothetical protein AMATHDRAFT_2265 [Amanita thiersii Skay4041]|uniref:BRCA2 OB1 domain-containing protein n=1 Tax=Amanita thiersii Skay4041 TaxID=703135 RepID=A0A2A9NNZ5_9AGAR|nr:hypothetical protein AMATHDRAFT_2265 [Amanita thiersii Skay4041]